jgi:crossover junction endodeoxyribonuclease RusA
VRRDVPAAARPEPVQQVVRVREGQWVIHLPFLTQLSLNDRMHHQVRAKAVKPWREAALVLVRHAKVPTCKRITVLLEYRPATNRRRDALNLAATLKPIEDGIVDAGVIPDDSGQFHTSVMPVILPVGDEFVPGSRFRVTITAQE